MPLGLMDMSNLPWEVVVESRIHLGNNMEGVALENGDVEMVVALYVVHMAHMVVGRMDMD